LAIVLELKEEKTAPTRRDGGGTNLTPNPPAPERQWIDLKGVE